MEKNTSKNNIWFGMEIDGNSEKFPTQISIKIQGKEYSLSLLNGHRLEEINKFLLVYGSN